MFVNNVFSSNGQHNIDLHVKFVTNDNITLMYMSSLFYHKCPVTNIKLWTFVLSWDSMQPDTATMATVVQPDTAHHGHSCSMFLQEVSKNRAWISLILFMNSLHLNIPVVSKQNKKKSSNFDQIRYYIP